MTGKRTKNPCILCGKQRIIVETYQEVVNNSKVTVTKTSCPDPECQKKVDNMLRQERLKRERLLNNRSNRGHYNQKASK